MKKQKIIIGSRGSKLALIYAQKAKDAILKNIAISPEDIQIKKIETKGDQAQNSRLSDIGGKGLFSSNIEKELLEEKIDIAIHALKDLPALETNGLITNSFLERNDPREVLITKNNTKLMELKSNPTIGTSSYRREFQVKRKRSDINCKLIRGNVDTRLKKLYEDEYDAIILSYAGLKSLSIKDNVSEVFSVTDFIPSAGQGVIALQCRVNDDRIISILKQVNHKNTFYRALAERNVLKVLEGSCETAVGVHAQIQDEQLILEAELFSLDGSKRYYSKEVSTVKDAKEIGKKLGEILKKKSDNSYKK